MLMQFLRTVDDFRATEVTPTNGIRSNDAEREIQVDVGDGRDRDRRQRARGTMFIETERG